MEQKQTTQCSDYLRVILQYPAYRLLLFSYVVDNLGNWFTLISCLSWADSFGGVRYTTLYLVIRLVPSFLFAPCLAPLTDSLDKRLGMIYCNIFSSLSVGIVALIVGNDSIHSNSQMIVLYLASLIQFSLDTLYAPLRGSLVPLLVAKEDLIVTSSLDGLGWSAIGALGATLGGFVTHRFGFQFAFSLDSISFLVSAALISFVPKERTKQDEINRLSNQKCSPSMNNEVFEYFFTNKLVLLLCFLRGCGSLLWGAADLLSVNFSKLEPFHRYGDQELTLGLVYATTGLGCQIAPFLWNAITPQNEYHLLRVVVLSFGQIAISYLIMMQATDIHHLLLATLVRTIASGIIWIYGSLLLQLLVPSSIQGRVLTFERAIYMVSKLLSTIMSGVGYGYFHWNNYQMSFFMTALGGIVFTIWSVIFFYYHLNSGEEAHGNYHQVLKEETIDSTEVEIEM